MENIYYTSNSFLGNLLCDLIALTADRKFNLVDGFKGFSGGEKHYVIPSEKRRKIDQNNAADLLGRKKLDDLIIVDRQIEKSWIPNLATVAKIHYLIELDWRGGNLEKIANLQQLYPQIEQFIGIKNSPPDHNDIDWNSWGKIEPDFNFPTLEIPRLDLPQELAMEISLYELTFGEYMSEFANRKEKRQIDRWLVKIGSRIGKIECLRGKFTRSD
jgi:hypothetical protein